MTKREIERLNELLKKKEEQEKRDRNFFREVRKRRAEVLRELGVKDEGKQAQEKQEINMTVDDDYYEEDDVIET